MIESIQNTDRELWRQIPDDFYSPSLHVTSENGIGINIGSRVIVQPIEKWFEQAVKEISKEIHG